MKIIKQLETGGLKVYYLHVDSYATEKASKFLSQLYTVSTMKKILLLPFFFAFQAGVFAQDHYYADSLKHLVATEQEEDTTTVIHYLRLASYYTWSFPDTAIMYYQKAYLLSNRLEFSRGLIYALEGQAYPLALVREDSAAVSTAFRSIQLAEEAKDNRWLAGAWFTLGSVYIHLRDFEKGLLYHRKALGYTSSSDTDFINVINQHIAGCFLGLNQPDSADMYAKKVLKYNKLHQVENGFDVYQMGSVFFQKGLLDSALKYYREGLAMVTKQGIRKDMANCNLGIANIFQERQVYDSAIYYAKAAWKIAGMTGLANEKLEALDQLTSLFAATGNTDSAFVYQQYALSLKDNIYNADKVRQVQLLAFNEELRKQQETEEQRKRSNRILVYTLLALLAFTIIIAGIIYRNNKLRQKAYALLKRQKEEIDRQKRAAEIEAALERIRAKAMSMHHSDELDEVLSVLCAQFDLLGINPMSTHITLLDIEHNKFTFRETGKFGDRSFGEQTVALDAMDTWKDMVESWKSAEPYSINRLHFPKETLAQVWEVFHESFASMPEGSKITPDDYPDGIYHTAGKHPFGYIGMNQIRKATPAEEQIVVKFANEFGRAYQRFLDLQKAEAQAREAQIEAALERVRSRTMAMHSSQDVDMIVTTLFDELLKLGVDKSIRSGIGIMDKSRRMEVWTASANPSGNTALDKGILDMGIHQLLIEVQEAWEAKKTTNSYDLVGDDLIRYFKAINDAPEYSFLVDFEKLPNKIIHYDFFFPEGALFAFSPTPLSDEISRVFMRFASVFGQTYRRYLDLKKAETQAREATLEAALERVRGKAMAMHNTSDLLSTAGVLFAEIRKLGINSFRSGVGLLTIQNRQVELYSATTSGITDNLPVVGWALLDGHEVLTEVYDCWLRKEDCFPLLKGESLKTYYQRINSTFTVPAEQTEQYEQYGYFLSFSEGMFYGWSEQPYTEDQIQILHRFKSIVDLTFRRFLELQRVEATALEVLRSASLDRVRAEIASMRTAEDLERITPLIWKELTTLGIPFLRCGVFIMDELEELIHTFLSTPDGKAIAAFHLPYTSNPFFNAIEEWRAKKIHISHWDTEEFSALADSLVKEGQLTNREQYLNSVPKGGLYLHYVPFLQGIVYVGNTAALTNENLQLVQSVADAFSTAYARYEDFTKLEQAKAKVESAMTELKATQSQLVQQEKLASLGQLTAGIAHEIKNPLNFVNNFSEVSMEMIEEIKEERAKSQETRDETLVDEILEDIQSNLGKIHEHGSRANGIVTSMLQHSRGGSGKMEPTDLNALIKEYVNLSFHGMRAGKNPINVDIILDLDPKLEEVSLIKEDFTRVVINLCNNAFDAMREKVKLYHVPRTMYQEREHSHLKYLPKLRVSTLLENGRLQIAFEDNGPGIPDEIKDKILQPFFTTKKGTEGTGLGLSITHDIVKAHGGEIELETSINIGTKFVIKLPV
jgi:signal transduction histidine kinase